MLERSPAFWPLGVTGHKSQASVQACEASCQLTSHLSPEPAASCTRASPLHLRTGTRASAGLPASTLAPPFPIQRSAAEIFLTLKSPLFPAPNTSKHPSVLIIKIQNPANGCRQDATGPCLVPSLQLYPSCLSRSHLSSAKLSFSLEDTARYLVLQGVCTRCFLWLDHSSPDLCTTGSFLIHWSHL